MRGTKADIAVDLFLHWLKDRIVRVVLPDGKFQRRNEGPIRTLGTELSPTVRLAPTAVVNLRLSWTLPAGRGRSAQVEFFLRADNLADQTVYSQLGLPEAGREIFGGARIEFTAVSPTRLCYDP